jgi:hypothetical protein
MSEDGDGYIAIIGECVRYDQRPEPCLDPPVEEAVRMSFFDGAVLPGALERPRVSGPGRAPSCLIRRSLAASPTIRRNDACARGFSYRLRDRGSERAATAEKLVWSRGSGPGAPPKLYCSTWRPPSKPGTARRPPPHPCTGRHPIFICGGWARSRPSALRSKCAERRQPR